ncbi:MAG: polysaccharide biosynthesis protein [Clostridia bacterium]|nr:polysaccharide biosynthesis protein [Clostridia bacterium]
MAKAQKSIIGGMTILGLTGIICKLIGVLYSVPLTWVIGTKGLGIFQSVFPTYNLLLTVSSAGLPVAVSRMVSHYIAKDDPRNARGVFKAALRMLTVLGLICTVIMLAGTPLLVKMVNVDSARSGFMVIAPCVAVVCVLSAFRGFMQGQQNMIPTAISQLIEQVGKVLISLPLAYFGFQNGLNAGAAEAARLMLDEAEAQAMAASQAAAGGATGALLGITLVEAIALVYMVVLYFRRRSDLDKIPQLSEESLLTQRSLAGSLFRISVPITISACIVPLAQFVDSAMMVDRMMTAGLDADLAARCYGIFSGLVIRLINIPTALALSISMSLVPAISSAMATEDMDGVRRQANLGLRFAFLIGLPCSIGMSVLAKPILAFFYAGTLTAQELQTGSELLTMSSLTVVLFTVNQAATAILQGLRKQSIPMYTLVAGVVCKIVLNYLLIGTPGIDIHGGPIASIVCYSVAMLPSLYFVLRYAKMKCNWMGWLIRPGIATAVMGAAVWLMRTFLPLNRLVTLLEIAVGIAVYVLIALAVKAITPEDLSAFRRKRRA